MEEETNHNDSATNDLDKTGYLQKKTTKGIWVNRFFVTDRNYLSYWHTRAQYDNKEDAAETFDLSEVKSIEMQGSKVFVLSFQAAGKFKVELSAGNDQERREWMGIIEGKRRLYSVDELLADLRAERISFRTKSFQVLMMLHERDQNKWILDRIDEGFHISSDESQAAKLRGDASALLQAAIRVVDEFILVCRDGEAEMASRSPKIMAHSRNYIKRYADILKGRIALELLYLPGITERHFELLGEKALCYSLEFLHRLDIVHQFAFVPREFAQTLHRSLFSFGDIISSLLNLGMKRVDIFFEQLPSFTPLERCRKLYDGISLFVTSLLLVQHHLSTPTLFCLVTQKLLSTQVLSVADHLQEFACVSRETQSHETEAEVIFLEEYEESVLLQHMESIYHWQQATAEIRIDVATRTIYHPATALRDQTSSTAALPTSLQLMQTATNFTQTLQSVASSTAACDTVTVQDTDTNSGNINSNSNSNVGVVIKVPASELDAFRFACDASARAAMLGIVRRYYSVPSQHLLLQHLFQEQHDGWLGGILITAWLNQVHTWTMYIVSSLPVFLQTSFIQEVCRIVLVMYWQRLVAAYQHHPTSKFSLSKLTSGASSAGHSHHHSHHHGVFSDAGVLQVQDDCRRMHGWMQSLRKATNQQEVSPCVVASDTAEMVMLTVWQGYVNITDPSQQVLPLFVDSIYQCGLPCVLYLYDILRLFLKMKKSSTFGSLMTDNARHVALAICEEFVYQLLQQPGVKDDGLLPGVFKAEKEVNASSTSTKSINSNNNNATNNANMNGNGYVYMLPLCESLCPELLSRHVFVTGSKWKWLSRPSLTWLFSVPLVSLGCVSSVASASVSGKHNTSANNSSKLVGGGNSPSLYTTSHKHHTSVATTANTSGLITDNHTLQVTLQVTELCNRALAQRRAIVQQSQPTPPSITPQSGSNKGSSDNVSKLDSTASATAETPPASICPPPRPARRRSSTTTTPPLTTISSETDTHTPSNPFLSDDNTNHHTAKSSGVAAGSPLASSDQPQSSSTSTALPPPTKGLAAHTEVPVKPSDIATKHPPGGHGSKTRPPPPPPPALPHPYTHHKPPAPPKAPAQKPSVASNAAPVVAGTNPFSSDMDNSDTNGSINEHTVPHPSMDNDKDQVIQHDPIANSISNNIDNNNIKDDHNPVVVSSDSKEKEAIAFSASVTNTATTVSTDQPTSAVPRSTSPTPSSPVPVAAKPPSWATTDATTSRSPVVVGNNVTTPKVPKVADSSPVSSTESSASGTTKKENSEQPLPSSSQKRRNTVFGNQSDNTTNSHPTSPVVPAQPSWFKANLSKPAANLSPLKKTSERESKQNEKTSNTEDTVSISTSAEDVRSHSATTESSNEPTTDTTPSVVTNILADVTDSEKVKPPPSKPQRRASAAPVLMTTGDNRSNSSSEATTSSEDSENIRRQEAFRKLLAQAQAQVKTSSSPVTTPP